MDSRLIICEGRKLRILIDSRSFDALLSKGDQCSERLLRYSTSEPFKFMRSPFEAHHDGLKRVPIFTREYNNEGNLCGIGTTNYRYYFGYRAEDIEDTGKTIFHKKSLNSDQEEAVTLSFIQAVLNQEGDMDILITNNETLLKKRSWLESHFPGKPLNIATAEEGKEIMDLFSKYRNKYYISGNYLCNKGFWYWLSFRSKIPNFHVGDPFLNAFSNRFVYLLMSADEMGFQYYSGVNNDTMDNTIYHFNYFLSLVTGIFDSLAIRTKNQYNLEFEGNCMPQRTSLNSKTGKEFLRAIREKNSNLRNHITRYVHFIKLVYQLRHLVIHKEMLEKIGFRSGDWKMNSCKIDQGTANLIHLCSDKSQRYESVSQWGTYELNADCFLEPFHFAKSAMRYLTAFSNEYLELLGFKNFIKQLKNKNPNEDFVKTVESFTKNNLGF